jgi:hypothetical protein
MLNIERGHVALENTSDQRVKKKASKVIVAESGKMSKQE